VALGALKATYEGAHPEDVLDRLGVMLSRKDMALAQAIVYVCLRHQSRLDFLIDGKLRAGSVASRTSRILLRMGLAQIMFLNRVPHHAAVNETTALGKSFAPGREGLINAVLRAFVRDKEANRFWPQERDGDDTPEVERLATFYSHPGWLVKKLVSEWGTRETRAYLAAGNQPAPAVLRLNPRAGDREAFARTLPFPVRPTQFSPWGLVPEAPQGRPDSWPGFAEGLFTIQDEASQLVPLLSAPPGGPAPRRILDCCAGKGGKSFALLGAFPDARCSTLDSSRLRLDDLSREAKRLGLSDRVSVANADVLKASLEPSWDLVLVDAPCTGLGILRRRPDIKWRRSPEDIPRFAELQSGLLASAAAAVRPGGRLVYCVCTVTREEGPEIAERFLAGNPDFRPAESVPDSLEPLRVCPGQYRTVTHRHRMDGFFYGVTERKA
jgi:16S rRNA (cytosine967-C5)-methyltransferase